MYEIAFLIFIAFLVLGARAIFIKRRARVRRAGRCCPHCGYSMVGVDGSQCPECGQSTQWEHTRRTELEQHAHPERPPLPYEPDHHITVPPPVDDDPPTLMPQ